MQAALLQPMASTTPSMLSFVQLDSTHLINPLSQSSASTIGAWQSIGVTNPCTTCLLLRQGFRTTLVRSFRTTWCAQLIVYTVIGGPNSPIANGSLISGLEVEIDYAYTCVEKMQTENISSMDVKEEAMQDFIEHRDETMKLYVWSGGCRSW